MSEAFAIRKAPAVRSFGLPLAKALKDSRTGEGDCGLGLRRQNRVWVRVEPSIKVLELARRPRPGTALFAVIVIVRGGVREGGRPRSRMSHERGSLGME
jgi:hypothetical protein